MYKYIYTYIYTYTVCLYIHIYVFTHTYIQTVCIYVFIYIYIYIYTYAYIDQPTHTSTIITTSYLFAREPSHCVASDKLIIHTLSPLFMHVHTTKAHVNISENCKGLYGVATISRLLKLTGLFCRI